MASQQQSTPTAAAQAAVGGPAGSSPPTAAPTKDAALAAAAAAAALEEAYGPTIWEAGVSRLTSLSLPGLLAGAAMCLTSPCLEHGAPRLVLSSP